MRNQCSTTASSLSRRSFAAGAAVLAGSALFGTAALAEGASQADQANQDASTDTVETGDLATIETPVPAYAVSVYAFDGVTIHAFDTRDALGDVCYLVEGPDEVVGIELPPMKASLEQWAAYVKGLGKPLANIWVDAHPNGADYVDGVAVWGTQASADAVADGSTRATADGLAAAFGDAWDANIVSVDTVVAEGPVTVGGIDFEVADNGDTYDLVVPAANCVYTHMLGAAVHSIVPSLEALDAMVATLRGYQQAGYALVLASHTMPEGQDAVAAKIDYLRTLAGIAANSDSAAAFVEAMRGAFPAYAGDNYLEMTAGFLFPAE